MKRIVRVKFNGARMLPGYRQAANEIKEGDPCDGSWGGGKVLSLTYDRELSSLVIRKDCKFSHNSIASDGKPVYQPYDEMHVPWEHVEFAAVVEEPELVGTVEEPAKSGKQAKQDKP
jgi:hypothetical protein